MKTATMLGSFAALAIILVGGAMAEAQRQHGGEAQRQHGGEAHRPPPPHPGETHAGPHGYDRVAEPHGWNTRPANFDRSAYQHNFQAARQFKIGAYRRPAGWVAHRWAFGQILPRAYFATSYLIADYWLFALEVPPAGYEWVRDDTDALLVSTDTGEILQVEYDVFA
jgi:Ni/Co efflux regulator RcnB